MIDSRQMCLLNSEQLLLHWGKIEAKMDADIQFNRFFTKNFILERLQEGSAQLWTAGSDLVIVTQVVNGARCRSLQIIWANGTGLDQLLPTIWEVLNCYAQMVECQRIELFGRPGWERKLRKLPGIELEYIALGCDVKQKERRQ